MDEKCIKVWTFGDAPVELQELSTHGGDEDWLALIPPALVGEYIPWLDDVSMFAIGSMSTHKTKLYPGYEVRIGAHA